MVYLAVQLHLEQLLMSLYGIAGSVSYKWHLSAIKDDCEL